MEIYTKLSCMYLPTRDIFEYRVAPTMAGMYVFFLGEDEISTR